MLYKIYSLEDEGFVAKKIRADKANRRVVDNLNLVGKVNVMENVTLS